MCIHVTFVIQLPCYDGHITGHGHAGAVYNKQILSSRTVQWQDGVVVMFTIFNNLSFIILPVE
jgi:hypothetical protein